MVYNLCKMNYKFSTHDIETSRYLYAKKEKKKEYCLIPHIISKKLTKSESSTEM